MCFQDGAFLGMEATTAATSMLELFTLSAIWHYNAAQVRLLLLLLSFASWLTAYLHKYRRHTIHSNSILMPGLCTCQRLTGPPNSLSLIHI